MHDTSLVRRFEGQGDLQSELQRVFYILLLVVAKAAMSPLRIPLTAFAFLIDQAVRKVPVADVRSAGIASRRILTS